MNILQLQKTLNQAFEGWDFGLAKDIKHGVLTSSIAFRISSKNPNCSGDAPIAMNSSEQVQAALGLSSCPRGRPKQVRSALGYTEVLQQKNPAKRAVLLLPFLQDFLDKENLPFEAKNVGPYINLKPKIEFYELLLKKVDLFKLEKESQTCVIEFFAPNVGKKIHVGNIRSANIGESLRRILSLKYQNVVSDSFLGDWGIQFSLIAYGVQNLSKLGLEFTTIDFEKEQNSVLADKIYQIYVKVNAMMDENEEIKKQAQNNSRTLENGLSNLDETEEYKKLFDLHQTIVHTSLKQFVDAEEFLNLNQNPSWLNNSQINPEKIDRLKNRVGIYYKNIEHKNEQFDLTMGESSYIIFLNQFRKLAEEGFFQKDGKAIFVDLEEEKLGRCYLISSEGYSLYQTRDIAARMVWAGVFDFKRAITMADVRQKHSFQQVFAVLNRFIKSGILKGKKFGWLSVGETARALKNLEKQMAQHAGFGLMTMPDGASMSTRKGKIFEFQKLREMLEEKVAEVLENKNAVETTPSSPSSKPEKKHSSISTLALASLKWADLSTDRGMNVKLVLDKFLKFEGNTGIYQLYTLARLKSILRKVEISSVEESSSFPEFSENPRFFPKIDLERVFHLNPAETAILDLCYTFTHILEIAAKDLKPSYITNFLFELATKINSWYVKNPVLTERNPERKAILIKLIQFLVDLQEKGLELLGIKGVETL